MKSVQNKKDLIDVIRLRVRESGWSPDLNDLDVSQIDDFSEIFSDIHALHRFNGNISRWNTKRAKTMASMFSHSCFNRDLSNWDVSGVEDMSCMFMNSEFNQPLSNWDVGRLKTASGMFSGSVFNQDLSGWCPSRLEYAVAMFDTSVFSGNVFNWELEHLKEAECMFRRSQVSIVPIPKRLKEWVFNDSMAVSRDDLRKLIQIEINFEEFFSETPFLRDVLGIHDKNLELSEIKPLLKGWLIAKANQETLEKDLIQPHSEGSAKKYRL